MASVIAIFSSTYHTKQLNPWPTSPARGVVIYSHLSACPGKMKPFKRSLCHSWTSDKLQKQIAAKAFWANFSTNIWLNCVQLSCDGEKGVFLLCGWKPCGSFHKDSNIICSFYIIYMHVIKRDTL